MPLDSSPSPLLAHISPDQDRRQTLQDHLEGTARLAAAFAKPFGGQEQAYLAGLLHDAGKASPDFQARLRGSPQKVDHSTAGTQEAWALRQPMVAFAVAGHHGGLPDGGSRFDSDQAGTLFGRLKKAVPPYERWRETVRLPAAAAGPPLPPDNFSSAFYTRMLYSCLVDADYLDTERFMDGKPAPRGEYALLPDLVHRLLQYVAPWRSPQSLLNQKRCEILETCFSKGRSVSPGLYSLTVPTGGGKTISSLAFALSHAVAQGQRRVIYVIPYTSIIDQTAEVFSRALGKENVLAHYCGAQALMQEDEISPGAYRQALAAENWDAPVIVTTAVQFFESLFSNRSSQCRKLHNIAGSVVVFDEAQTLPIGYLRPCVAAIGQLVQHYGTTAVLCTATQPALEPLFAQLAPGLPMQEICGDPTGMFTFFQRVTLRHAGPLTEEQLLERLRAVPQALCVVNRRKTAQSLYEALPEEGRFCLTTLLCPADRKHLLQEIRARLKSGLPCRVVSTSLIEAGVDVDFPAAWREEAGLDSILQTAGRCNREGRRPAGESIVTVFGFAEQSPPAMLRPHVDATHTILRQFEDIACPQAIETYFTLLFTLKGAQSLDQAGVLEGFARGIDGRILPFATIAGAVRLIDSPACTVYIPLPENAALFHALRAGQHSQRLFRQLGVYGVTVYPDHLAALRAAAAVELVDPDVWVLSDPTLYDRQLGLKLCAESGRAFFI